MPIRIIKNRDIGSLAELQTFKSAVIYGKGPTFKLVHENETSQRPFVVCVNDTVNVCKQCDMLVVNDIETWPRIVDDKLRKAKYVLTPVFPHVRRHPQDVRCHPHPDVYIPLSLDILWRKGYEGNVVFYNLPTAPLQNPDYPILDSVISGSNNAVDFLMKFMKLDLLRTVGVGVSGESGHHQSFRGAAPAPNVYSEEHLATIRDHIRWSTRGIRLVSE